MSIADLVAAQNRLVEQPDGTYLLVTDLSGTASAGKPKADDALTSPIFRLFQPVAPAKGRKLNTEAGQLFDPYVDTLMDYPSIIGAKLGRPWREFNRMISCHVLHCRNHCWHCYLPLALRGPDAHRSCEPITAEELVRRFKAQRQADADRTGEYLTNVLRITGGEPFNAPHLIRDCLRLIEADNDLTSRAFLWVESNLHPFIGAPGKAFIESVDASILSDIAALGSHLAVHPCFHGLTERETFAITRQAEPVPLDDAIQALKRLVDHKIDVYPSIGANVIDPGGLPAFFEKLLTVGSWLPLRVALIDYEFDRYASVREEMKDRGAALYPRSAAFRVWNDLLLARYGLGYGVVPRHLANEDLVRAIKTPQSAAPVRPYAGPQIVIGKSSYREQYHRELLELIALPDGHRHHVDYEKKWVDDDLFVHSSECGEQYTEDESLKHCVFGYVDNSVPRRFPFIPLREVVLRRVRGEGDVLRLEFTLGRYIASDEVAAQTASDALLAHFGARGFGPGGKYVALGERLFALLPRDGRPPTPAPAPCNIETGNDYAAFERLAKTLFLEHPMQSSVLYRVLVTGAEQDEEDGRTVYSIVGGRTASLRIEYVASEGGLEGDAARRTIWVESWSDTLEVVGPGWVEVSKYGWAEVKVRAKAVETHEAAGLSLASRNPAARAARVNLTFVVEPPPLLSGLLHAGKEASLLVVSLGYLSVAAAAPRDVQGGQLRILGAGWEAVRPFWWQTVLWLLGVWVVATGVLFVARSIRSKAMGFIEKSWQALLPRP